MSQLEPRLSLEVRVRLELGLEEARVRLELGLEEARVRPELGLEEETRWAIHATEC